MARRATIWTLVTAFMLCGAPAAVASSMYATAVLGSPSLVSLWRLNERGQQTDAEGTAVADATAANPGAYHLGVNFGQPGSLEGDPATAAQFGSPDGYAQVPYSARLNTPTFTIEGWVNFTKLANNMVVVGNGAQLTDFSGYTINTFDDFGKPSLDLWIGNGSTSKMLRGIDYTPGQWIYFAGTYDGTTARWYENGQLVSSVTSAYVPNTTLPDFVGLNPVNNGTGQLVGSVDDLAVYSSALSTSTLQQHYQAGIQDGLPPETVLQSAPSGITNETYASVQFGSTSVNPTFQCQLDGGAWASCSSPYQIAGLANGLHHVAVRAVNRAGQVDTTPPSVTWTVDTVAPAPSFSAGPPAATASTQATFSFSLAPGATYLCQLDQGPAMSCSSPYSLSGLVDGSHVLTVQATDAAGNFSTSTYSWAVDTAPPTAFITQGPNAQHSRLPFTFVANQNSVTFSCRVDNGPWSPCRSPFTALPTTAGQHIFRVRATNALGTIDPSDHAYTWVVADQSSLQVKLTFPRRIQSPAARHRALLALTHRCAKRPACIAKARAALVPHLSWHVNRASTLSITILTAHGREVAHTTLRLRALTGSAPLPTALLARTERPGAYTAVARASATGLIGQTITKSLLVTA